MVSSVPQQPCRGWGGLTSRQVVLSWLLTGHWQSADLGRCHLDGSASLIAMQGSVFSQLLPVSTTYTKCKRFVNNRLCVMESQYTSGSELTERL